MHTPADLYPPLSILLLSDVSPKSRRAKTESESESASKKYEHAASDY